MSYTLLILRRAQKQLASLPVEPYRRLREGIRRLSESPRPAGAKQLVAREGWRLRVGEYRVVYEIDDRACTVTILDVGHRRDVYR